MRNLVMLLHCPGAKLIHIIPRSTGFPGFFLLYITRLRMKAWEWRLIFSVRLDIEQGENAGG